MATRQTHNALIVGLLLSLTFFAPHSSDAMPIPQFDAMSEEARAQYIGQLFGNTVQMLWDQKRDADAEKVENLFTQKPNGEIEGLIELNSAIAGLRNPPDGKTYHVEHAFAHILRGRGMPLSPDELKHLAQIGRNFKPGKAISHAGASR